MSSRDNWLMSGDGFGCLNMGQGASAQWAENRDVAKHLMQVSPRTNTYPAQNASHAKAEKPWSKIRPKVSLESNSSQQQKVETNIS